MQLNFCIKPTISDAKTMLDFFEIWKIGKTDLLVTNEFVVTPHLKGNALPCDVLYQERFGKGEPSDDMFNAMQKEIEGKNYKRIIAIGGGTVIDISKLFVFGGALSAQEIFDEGAKLLPKRQLIIVPTTCGTGSEVTNISILEFKQKQTKIGLALPALYAEEAVLIGEMLETLPYDVFAASSLDAFAHAAESFVSPKANAFTRALGQSAIKQILQGYKKLAASGNKQLPKGDEMKSFVTASTMAGISFGNAGCAAVHALSYPIGANYHLPHGKAVYITLAEVFKTYKRMNVNLLDFENVLADALECPLASCWNKLFVLFEKIYPQQGLASFGADEEKCAEMAVSVAENQQRLLANNPVELSVKDIEGIFKRCL